MSPYLSSSSSHWRPKSYHAKVMINLKTYACFPSHSKQHYRVSTLNPIQFPLSACFSLIQEALFPNGSKKIKGSWCWRKEKKRKERKIAGRTKRQSNGRIRAIPKELLSRDFICEMKSEFYNPRWEMNRILQTRKLFPSRYWS